MADRVRMERAQQRLRADGIDALLVGPGADLRYLVGYHALPLERLTLLVVPCDGAATLVVPELEAPRARASGAAERVELRTWAEHEDPFALVGEVVDRAGLDRAGAFAVQDRLWSSFLLRLQDLLPGARWLAGSAVMAPLRRVKDPEEVAALRAAAQAIDRVHAVVPSLLRPGRTEAEVGRDIADLILDEHETVNFVIVASGPNGASPHHETGDRVLAAGDAIVVDIGGTRQDYCSDATRNYILGVAPDGYEDLHEVLHAAQEAGVAAARAGVTAQEVDRTCRSRIDAAGYGQWFVHRTGHGIGVEEHEEPYIVEGNQTPLEPGMAFSVEPGIYVPGRYGARIEDIVVARAEGGERLNTLPRGLVVVDI